MNIFGINQFIRIKVIPIMIVIMLVALTPWFVYIAVIDRQYCANDKNIYEHSFEEIIVNKQINNIITYAHDNSRTIVYSSLSGVDYYMGVCSDYSKESQGKKLYIGDVIQGNILYKEANSNLFTIIEDGRHYIFEIDPNRKKDGNYKDHITLWDKVKKIWQ